MTTPHGRVPPTLLHPDHDYCSPCLALVEKDLNKDLEKMAHQILRDTEGLTDSTISHGTVWGYTAHLKKGTTCAPCRAANAKRQQEKRSRRKANEEEPLLPD